MSVTSHLHDAQSPVRGWFLENLPHTRPLVGAGNNLLCGKPRSPCLLAPPTGCDRALSGTAIDYLFRAVARRGALDRTIATAGAPRLASAAVRLEREAVAAVSAHLPLEEALDPNSLSHVCRMCLLLARFEQFFRAGPVVWKYVGAPLQDQPTLEGYADRVVPELCLVDLERLATAVIEDYADIRQTKNLMLNPTFELSAALGGADADLIADHKLWDLKSSADDDKVFHREDLWQLIGYALADRSDKYEIRTVGLVAIRRRKRVEWFLEKLLDELADEPRPLERWRADFAAVVELQGMHRRASIHPNLTDATQPTTPGRPGNRHSRGISTDA